MAETTTEEEEEDEEEGNIPGGERIFASSSLDHHGFHFMQEIQF